MNPRIERIKVNREGPLEKDFEMNPADLNLIYGLNETGKTYLLESLVRLLFKMKGKQAREEWKLREWDTNGEIEVSGLEGDGKVTSFVKTSKMRFEDYLVGADEGLPQDFSRLLVVRAGETVLSGDPDGVGRDILKDYLSEERLLDELGSDTRISITIKNALVEEGAIIGDNRGEIKKRKELRIEVESITALLDEVNLDFSEGPVSTLRKELAAKRGRVDLLGRARRHQAYLLRSERSDLEAAKADLVSSAELVGMESKIKEYDGKVKDGLALEGELEDLQAAVGKRQWCEEALRNYDGIMNRGDVTRPRMAWIISAAVFFIAAVIGGFIDRDWLLGAGALLSVVLVSIYVIKLLGAAPTAALADVELERMSRRHEEHFGEPLGDRASLLAQLKFLERQAGEATVQAKALDTARKGTRALSVEIESFFGKAGIESLEPGDWTKTLEVMKKRFLDIEREVQVCSDGLERLGVQPELDLEEDPGIGWDPGQHSDLSGEIAALVSELEAEDGSLENLRQRVASVVQLSSGAAWDQLLEGLQELKNSTLREYRECTAEILAKIGLWQVLEELRQKETERIEQGLEKEALRNPLSALTGKRYQSIHLVEEDDLQLSDAAGNSYALAKLSTGVREQVCLALRFGFASIALGGEPAFLLLDDAFQHSDWERRPRMIEYVVELTRQGWQVFYFTMDDHIRDRFLEAGRALGPDRFLYENLSAGEPASTG